MPGKPVLDVS